MAGIVVTYSAPRSIDDHERQTHAAIARTLAALKGFSFGGEYDASKRPDGPLYFVPSDTLLADDARALGIRSGDDLFGGVVPHAFVAKKAIVHPLLTPGAHAPRGWSAHFAERVRDVVLPGFAAFAPEDARRAALHLLAQGPVRLKLGEGVGGHGQWTLTGAAELEAALACIDPAHLELYGAVVELDLADATTYSVGQVRVAGMVATYFGTQRMTTDNAGEAAFGGSDLFVARGGYDALSALPMDAGARIAIAQAKAFDEATTEFAGLFASRRNYDAVRGRDSSGSWRSGVLEQSWRIGGASGPEVAALEAFRASPRLQAVHARSIEAYGDARAPAGAIVHFSGVDARVGALTKFTLVEAYEAA